MGIIVIIIRLDDAEDTLHTALPATTDQWQDRQNYQFIPYMCHASRSTNFVYQLSQTVVFGDDIPLITLQSTNN